MPDVINALTAVWTAESVATAVLGGGMTGVVLGRLLSPNPAYQGKTKLIVGFSVIGGTGLVFWIGQIIEAWAAGDPFWYRAVSRALLYLLFAAALAAAGWLTPPAKALR